MKVQKLKKQVNGTVDVALINNDSIWIINPNITWYKRLWYLLSNPFSYLFTGKVRL